MSKAKNSAARQKPGKSGGSPAGKSRKNIQQVDTVVEEGDLIAFEHTGETLKVTKIEGNTIVFEKSP